MQRDRTADIHFSLVSLDFTVRTTRKVGTDYRITEIFPDAAIYIFNYHLKNPLLMLKWPAQVVRQITYGFVREFSSSSGREILLS